MAGAQDDAEGESGRTDADWQTWDDYADRVTVEVPFREWVGADDGDEVWVLISPGATWSKEWLKRQIVDLAAASDSGCSWHGSYELEVRERRTEWGASASMVDAILTLAESQLSNLTWLALGALGQQLGTRLKGRRDEWAEQALTDPGVQEHALSAVLRLREVRRDALEIRSIETTDGKAVTAEIRDLDSGAIFIVRVESKSGRVLLARVRKLTDPGSSGPATG